MNAKTKFALSTLVSVVLALGMFLLVLLISHNNNHEWDITQNKRFSLSEQSMQVVRELKAPVDVLVFLAETDDAGRSRAEDLLDNYKAVDPSKLRYELVDPKKKPTLAKKYEVRMPGQVVVVSGEQTQRATAVGEEELTNALLKLSDQKQKKVYFLTGHGERPSEGNEADTLSKFRAALAKEGYSAADLNLVQQKTVPADAAVLVSAGPVNAMLAPEQDALRKWVAGGGRLMLMLELESGDKYDGLLKEYGFRSPLEAILDDQAQIFGTEPVFAVGVAYAPDQPITRSFRLMTLFNLCRPVDVLTEGLPAGATVKALASTGPAAFSIPGADLVGKQQIEIRSDAISRKGDIPLAAAGVYPSAAPAPTGSPSPAASPAAKGPEGRIVVVGDTDFVSNALLEVQGNRDFALNVVNWLAEAENRITIRPKDAAGQPIMLGQGQGRQIQLLLILAIPFAVLLAGFMTAFRRR